MAHPYFKLRENFSSKQLTPHPHESECVSDLEYDPEHYEMTIHFVKRGSYIYYGIEPWLFAEFNNSGSRGQYFNQYIRPMYSDYQRIA
jgi:hypothetical protein